MKLIAMVVLLVSLPGCSYKVLTGEQGYEAGVFMKPITQSEERHEFKPKMLTFSRSDFDGDTSEQMPK